ncbi:MAG: HAD family phosphatase [Clostridia bacterium]|nr:HAD family phosphatase [Clostridia bacterium]MBQ7038604.1 HAD family phosphatase [Clostridia bacterium]
MIKNYIFDFGNVLARFDPDELTAVHVGDANTRKTVSDVVFDRLYWDRLDDGSITDEEVKSGICSRLPSELHECACRVYEDWIISMPTIKGMDKVVADIKARGGKLYLLSNISIGFAETYTANPAVKDVLDLFDGLVFSGPIGLAKPHRAIYEHLLSRFQLTAEECLFIDDNAGNIAAAKEVGIHGYLFDGDVDALRKSLLLEES